MGEMVTEFITPSPNGRRFGRGNFIDKEKFKNKY
jgi:hypothetical protein